MQIRPTASAYGLIINFSIALFRVYTEFGIDSIMTIIETAKRNGLDVYGYLLYLLTTLPALGKNPSEEELIPLLPWSDSLPGYCKATCSEIL